MVPKNLEKGLKELEIRRRIEAIQTALLRLVKTEENCLFKFQWKYTKYIKK